MGRWEPVGTCSCHECNCLGCARCGDAHEDAPADCPECRAGKHGNCDGTTWDEAADAPTACPCSGAGHE